MRDLVTCVLDYKHKHDTHFLSPPIGIINVHSVHHARKLPSNPNFVTIGYILSGHLRKICMLILKKACKCYENHLHDTIRTWKYTYRSCIEIMCSVLG